jgi:hypothetical protein
MQLVEHKLNTLPMLRTVMPHDTDIWPQPRRTLGTMLNTQPAPPKTLGDWLMTNWEERHKPQMMQLRTQKRSKAKHTVPVLAKPMLIMQRQLPMLPEQPHMPRLNAPTFLNETLLLRHTQMNLRRTELIIPSIPLTNSHPLLIMPALLLRRRPGDLAWWRLTRSALLGHGRRKRKRMPH